LKKELKLKSALFNQIKYLSKKIETGNL